MDFKCDIRECDVRSKKQLQVYRQTLLRWHKWMFDQRKGIWVIIQQLLLNDAIFRMINQARGMYDDQTGFNWLFLESYDFSFIRTQLVMMRSIALDNKGDIISLRKLVDNIRKHECLITRENFVCYDGFAFDDLSIWQVDKRHNLFDIISNTPNRRNRKDLLAKNFVEKLDKNLSNCLSLLEIINRNITHNEISKTNSNKSISISLDKLDSCYKEICQLATLISSTFLNEGISLIPSIPYPASKDFDKPWVLADRLSDLNQFWSDRASEVNKWCEADCINNVFLVDG